MRWNDVEYEVVPSMDSRLFKVVAALQESYSNGGTILRILKPREEWKYTLAYRTDLGGVDHWLRSFLQAQTVREAVRELQIPPEIPNLPKYTGYGGFEFEGAITQLLLRGGAYGQLDLSEDAARHLSRDFVNALTDSQPSNIFVIRIDEPWTDWFYDVAWDSTFVVMDSVAMRWTLLGVTDTD